MIRYVNEIEDSELIKKIIKELQTRWKMCNLLERKIQLLKDHIVTLENRKKTNCQSDMEDSASRNTKSQQSQSAVPEKDSLANVETSINPQFLHRNLSSNILNILLLDEESKKSEVESFSQSRRLEESSVFASTMDTTERPSPAGLTLFNYSYNQKVNHGKQVRELDKEQDHNSDQNGDNEESEAFNKLLEDLFSI